MGRRRLLAGERLQQARDWYALWSSIPSPREKARQLGVGVTTLRLTVKGLYKNMERRA
jgi:hypothetical protein